MTFSLGPLAPFVRLADILDIIVISFLVYFILLWLRRKASRPVALGAIAVGVAYILAQRLRMYLTSMVFQTGLTALLVLLVLLLQDDLRRFFDYLSNIGTFRSRKRRIGSNQSIDELLTAISAMARDRIGALVVLKGREDIERLLRGGVYLSGRISMPVVCSIFNPKTPGHDGAMIIDGDRIEKFKVQLPLSSNLEQIRNRGTRHSAALGLSERSDALVIVVSEELGTVSVAEEGSLHQIESMPLLKERIDRFYAAHFPSIKRLRFSDMFGGNAGLKAAALALASLLWLFLANRVNTVNRTYSVPIEYRNLPRGWVISQTRQNEARVSLAGPERAFSFDPTALLVSIDMSVVREGANEITITPSAVTAPRGVTVTQIHPRTLMVEAHKVVSVDVPVRANLVGQVPAPFFVKDVKIQPPTVRCLVLQSRASKLSSVSTQAFSLTEIDQTTTVRLQVVLPDTVQFASNQSSEVRVTIEVEKETGKTPQPATPEPPKPQRR